MFLKVFGTQQFKDVQSHQMSWHQCCCLLRYDSGNTCTKKPTQKNPFFLVVVVTCLRKHVSTYNTNKFFQMSFSIISGCNNGCFPC